MKDRTNHSGKVFWDRVIALLECKHIKKAELSRRIGKDTGTLSSAIRRGNMPLADSAFRIAEVLGTSVEYLVVGTDSTELGDFSDEQELKMAFQTIKQSRYMSNIAEALPFLNLEQLQAIHTIIKSMGIPIKTD